ncbi:MAG TPA: radical SAM protein [Candidatus Omnitrophota bacterium]|nr:radical SAM protein [Candidatus Omnitrophota bacterium]
MLEQNYVNLKKVYDLPRLPLEGSLDLTYRCNDNCRHCWLRISPDSEEKKEELSFDEIKRIVSQAKAMGCRRWSISGGEPMLRPDFPQIFDYITSNSSYYSLNTNGTLITPMIAQLMKRKGTKMVALYGATAEVHDHITRSPGSFEATMRGFNYLKEAGAGFMAQLIPMKDNYHQFQEMVRLAESLSPHYRIGAAWLYFSACGDAEVNKEIARQRLSPEKVIELDRPDLSYDDWMEEEKREAHYEGRDSEHLLSSCIALRRDFHIDPYGRMSFCCFVKDESLRYDLRKGSFKEAWEEFIPSLTNKIKVSDEYLKNCGSCELREDCRWCPVYGYLEHRRFNAKVSYLCAAAKENRRFKDDWQKNHRRYYKIADITIQLESDLPIDDETFRPKFKQFQTNSPDKDMISITHHFSLPDLNRKDLGLEVYRKPPWAIYKKGNSWVYLGISPADGDNSLHRVVVFNQDHSRARIYNDTEKTFLKGGLHSLTLFPTDQIILARILADRQGFYLHSCGVNFNGRGLLFAGHSEAGKSTMATMLKPEAEILCDDRMIIRKNSDGFMIYGTWSHGDVPDVSVNSAPLKAILFLEKAKDNMLIPLTDKKEIAKRLLGCLIRPFVTNDWWEKTLAIVEKIPEEVPCYILQFDKSGKALDLLKKL